MKLYLLLCLTFVPWSQCRSSMSAQKPATQTHDIARGCENMERLREAHLRERMQIPRGDKFVDFDWSLIKELNAVERGNIVISPVSLKVVLAMLYEGAKGQTAEEIGNALDLYNNTMEQRRHTRERFSTILSSLQTSTDDYKIKMGTHAFIDKSAEVQHNYQCKLKTYYNSDIVPVDFSDPAAAVHVINNWARNVTEGHIQDLISESEDQSSTIMLLLNAVYFKGQWEIPFPTNQTKPGTFHLDNKKTVEVQFMNVTDKFGYYDLRDIGAHMVELPYKGNKFSMYVLLPYNTSSLDAIAKALGPNKSLSGIIGHMMPTDINLIMPKFEFKFTTKLRSTLEKLGIKTMFTTQAQLDDIAHTKGRGLAVSNVLQKAGISVTEAGTVAYAATVADLGNKFGGSEETVDFIIDRPFMFFIEDTTLQTTVFVGKVTNPDSARVVSPPPKEASSSTSKPAMKPTTQVAHEAQPGSETDALGNRVGDGDQTGNKRPSNQPATEINTTRGRFNFFDGELLGIVGDEVKGNFVISPASVKTLLGLLLEAAEKDTLNEIKRALRLPADPVESRKLMSLLKEVLQNMNDSQVEVDSETMAFLAKDFTFNTSYVKQISEVYNAGVTPNVDFKNPENAVNKINSWVLTQTRGKIQNLIAPGTLAPETMTVLVNTVYFSGRWKTEFMLKDTKEDCFYSEHNQACTKVPIMYKKDILNYKFDKDYKTHIVQLPYKDERFSLVLVVPNHVNGTKDINRDIDKLTFPRLLEKATPREVHLHLPRFSAEYSSDLQTTLAKMRLNTLFTEQAQLPFMINNKQARVSAVIHKAKIEVNEQGTKAAASSGASVVPLMSGNEAVVVVANLPFYYFVYEVESRSVLFSGRISTLSGDTGNEENLVGEVGAYPLAVEEPRPSYAQVADNRPASSSLPQNYPIGPASSSLPQNYPSERPQYRPQNYPERPQIQPQRAPGPQRPFLSTPPPPGQGVQYIGSGNQDYNLVSPTMPPQRSTTPSDRDHLEYPPDNDHQSSLSNKYLEKFAIKHSNNNPQQRRSFRF